MIVKIKTSCKLPRYQTPGSSGMDIHASLEEPIWLFEDAVPTLIPTGLFMEIPCGYEAQIRSRSGLAMDGIVVQNSPGTVDSDYRGEIKVMLKNTGGPAYRIQPLDRIAQIVFAPVERVRFEEVEELYSTKRGSYGFGSTGK